MIIYYPGSFKPPHRGHFSIIEKLLSLKNVESIIIYISSKSRFCELKKKEYTAQQSKEIWNFYMNNCLSEAKREKIKIRISYFPSPIYQVYSEISRNKKTKNSQTYSIVKSTKDEGNTRFDLFKKLEQSGYHIEYKTIKELGKLSSSDYRCLLDSIKTKKITETNRKILKKYYPKKIPKDLLSTFEKLLLTS
jgi:cytidyltransferase-like protein